MPSAIERLERMRQNLERKIKSVLDTIGEIKSSHPYTMRSRLEDAGWVAGQQRTLRESIAQLTAKKATLEAMAKQLTEDPGDG